MSILVATDLSTRSVSAIRFAEELSERLDAPLTILHAAPNTRPDIVPDAQNALQMFLREYAEAPDAHTTDVIVGDTLQLLVKNAAQHELVVCGATGSSYLDDIFLGSTASRLIREAEVPVCVVPDGHVAQFDSVLVAMGFDDASRAAMSFADDVAEQTGATLHIVSAVPEGTVQDEVQKKLDVLAAGRERVRTHILQGEPAECIRKAVVDFNIDIAVMGTHGRDQRLLYFLGSVAERVVRQPPCAVITVRPFGE